MIDLFSNPELLRNSRAQLRFGRMIAGAAVCAILSVVVGFSMAFGFGAGDATRQWAMAYLKVILGIQVFVLLLGGAVACLNSIQREKDLNTFDFQRVTRLTPLDLTLGKLFGAPITVYYIALCFLPAALVGAVLAHARPSFLLAAYAVMIVGCITAHSLCLLFSLILQRTTNSSGVLVLLLFYFIPWAGNERFFFDVGQSNPFVAVSIVDQTRWETATSVTKATNTIISTSPLTDVFFGIPLHHVPVLLLLYLSFTALFLLAVVRNIKRDPSAYELFTPEQALGLIFFINFLMLGFFRWSKASPWDDKPPEPYQVLTMFLGSNITLLFILGMTLLRNRDRVRRRIREFGASATSWLAAVWPSHYLLLGALIVGFGVMAMIQRHVQDKQEWNLGLAAFRVAFCAAWVARDVLYLQWMNLRRVRRTLAMGVLFLLIFYGCALILFLTFDFFTDDTRMLFTSLIFPTPSFILTSALWKGRALAWIAVLIVQFLLSGLFVYLHREKLLELAPHVQPATAPPAPPAPQPTAAH